MSPGSRSQLEVCLGAAEQALHALNHTCINMAQITSSLPACSDSHAFRGKIRSLLDAAESTAAHTQLLLTDAVAVCARKSDGSANDLQRQVAQLQEELSAVRVQLNSSITQLQAALEARLLASQSTLNMALTQLQKQLASTAALDGTLKTVGTAYAALLGLMRKEGAAVARQFLQDSSSSSGCSAQGPQAGALPAVTSKVLKLGDCAMKRLRNGDIYKGCYQGLRKNGGCVALIMRSDLTLVEPCDTCRRVACILLQTCRPHEYTDQCAVCWLMCLSQAKAATAFSTAMCTRDSSRMTVWLAVGCTALRPRAGGA